MPLDGDDFPLVLFSGAAFAAAEPLGTLARGNLETLGALFELTPEGDLSDDVAGDFKALFSGDFAEVGVFLLIFESLPPSCPGDEVPKLFLALGV